MKRFLVLASVAAVMLSSCNKTEELRTGGDLEKTVSFETHLGNQTKAVEKTAFKMGDQFLTYGVKTAAAFDVKIPAFTEYVFLGNGGDHASVVSHYGEEGGNAIWNCEELAPWDENKATFFAFSPVPQGAKTYGITLNGITNNTIPTIGYEVVGGYDPAIVDLNDPVAAAARSLIKTQPDLLRAFSANNIKSGGSIQMQFHHVLSQVRFSVRAAHSAGSFLRLNSITLTKVKTKSVLALANDETNKGNFDYLGGWAAATEEKNFDVNLKAEVVRAIPGGVTTVWPVTDNDESLMMIPQNLTGVGLEVRYSYSPDGIEWTDYESGTSQDYVLSTLTPYWNPNKNYNYIINITPGKSIVFKPIVESWDPQNTTADLEYRKFEVAGLGGSLAKKSDGSDETFTLKDGDKISVSYTNGTGWLEATDPAASKTTLVAGSPIAITVANAGEWTLSAAANDAPGATIRKATIVIERAPYDKTLSDGSTIKVASGIAKYEISQSI